MSFTEKDHLVPTTPTIKKPKTLNPLGAVVYGLLLSIGHYLIYASLLRVGLYAYFSVFGFLLAALSVPVIIVALNLTTKSILFTYKLDKRKTLPAQTILQILLFYIGFTPIYGFGIMYLETTIEFWEIMVNSVIVSTLFGGFLILNIFLMNKEKPSLGHLKQLLYQPKKILIVCIGISISAIVTAVIIFF